MLHRSPSRAVALVLCLLAAACSSGSSGSKGASSSTTAPAARLVARPGFVNVVSVNGEHSLTPADQRELLAAVVAYVRAASIAPLSGKPATGVDALFVPAAAAAITGPERATLLDADLPATTGPVNARLGRVSLHGLADATGAIDLVGATIDLTVTTRAAKGPITIHRTGELMYERDGGGWKVLGFQLAVTRDGAGLGPDSAASASSATSTPEPQP